ncbi:MAG TPA: RNase adapter RapZ [Candidatus Nanoarchaeia archaeon]|nr:RNase adapter RapZ [Candidatus Nanoarchaeia archaeon]
MSIQKSTRKIIVRSFGLKYLEHYPRLPAVDSKTLFFMTDVRFLPDPCQNIPKPGDDEEVYQKIINQPEISRFLALETVIVINQRAQYVHVADFSTLELNYFCYAGYHRSVAVARYIHEKLKETGRGKNLGQLELVHLTKDIRQAELNTLS